MNITKKKRKRGIQDRTVKFKNQPEESTTERSTSFQSSLQGQDRRHSKRIPLKAFDSKTISNTLFIRNLLVPVFVVIVSIGYKVLIFDSSIVHPPNRYHNNQGSSNRDILKKQQKIDSFLSWLQANGANISKHVTLAEFREYGGYGLVAVPTTIGPYEEKWQKMEANTEQEKYHGDRIQNIPVIRELDELFRIPEKIIISTQSVLDHFTGIRGNLIQLVKSGFPDSFMVQQDAVIALFLMEQCGLGRDSKFYPYMEVLPQKVVPRLDTFQEEDLTLLQDGYLSKVARESHERLWKFYHHEEFQSILRNNDMMGHRVNLQCYDFESFHRFMSIASSRAMVLNGWKHLTPLADMINYQSRSEERIKNGASQTFLVYHEKHVDGSITVRADRDIGAYQQIFEDYGDLDNSLYLEAHGFVPDINPFHCATIEGKHYLFDPNEGERKSSDSDSLLRVMLELDLLPSSSTVTSTAPNLAFHADQVRKSIPDFCVKQDGSVDGDALAVKILTVAALSATPDLMRRCVEARDKDVAELECLHYLNKTELRNRLVRRMARRKFCDGDSIEKDQDLLQSLQANSLGNVSEQKILSLKFRIAEKQTLSRIGNMTFADCHHFKTFEEDISGPFDFQQLPWPTFNESSTYNDEILHENIERFNRFINSLDLPIIKIQASYIDDNMRLGVTAQQDIAEGDIYLSIPSSFVLDSESFRVNEGDVLGYELLQSLKANFRDGGFDLLLFALLYEGHVKGENSQWYPYLQILPTLEDLQRKSPLFWHDDLYDCLAGSELRIRLVAHKTSARMHYDKLFQDIRYLKVLGVNKMTYDNFLWAFTIIHSRSIWWNGARHLVPLLDMVNCAELVDSIGRIAAPHVTQKEGDSVITRAGFSFKMGDQIFENYSQPNHVYYIYHGFIVENNHNDCILIDGRRFFDGAGTLGSEYTKKRLSASGFDSISTSFCLHGKESLDRLSNYVRIIRNLPGDTLGLAEDVRDPIVDEIQRRLQLYRDVNRFSGDDCHNPNVCTMKSLVENERLLLIKLSQIMNMNLTTENT